MRSERYICLDCGEVFEEPKRFSERHGMTDPPCETKFGCPRCGGAYVRAYRCDLCGDLITEEFVEVGQKHYCGNCFTIRNYNIYED